MPAPGQTSNERSRCGFHDSSLSELLRIAAPDSAMDAAEHDAHTDPPAPPRYRSLPWHPYHGCIFLLP